MCRRLLVALSAGLLVLGSGLMIVCPSARAETVFPPGMRVGLEPQGGLTLSTRFPGFEDAERKVAVTILQVPPPAYEELERSAFIKDQPGMAILKRESFPFVSGIGFLISGQAKADGVTTHKTFLLATAVGGAKDLAILINVEVPDKARAVYTDAVVRKMLASVTFRATPLEEQLAMLPFKVKELAGFRVLQALPNGGLILTDGPSDDISKQPYVIVSVGSGAPATPDERGRFARDLLSSAPLRDLAVTLLEPMRIGGQQGVEIRAQAKGLGGEPVSLAQWVRFGSGGFLRVVGVVRQDDWDALFTRFRAVRDGIEPR